MEGMVYQPDPMGWKVTKVGVAEQGYILTFPELKVVDNVPRYYCMVMWGEGVSMSTECIEVLTPVIKDSQNVTPFEVVNNDETTH